MLNCVLRQFWNDWAQSFVGKVKKVGALRARYVLYVMFMCVIPYICNYKFRITRVFVYLYFPLFLFQLVIRRRTILVCGCVVCLICGDSESADVLCGNEEPVFVCFFMFW